MTLPIGDAIRYVRKTRGLNATAVSKKAGLPRNYVCKVEKGHTVPKLDNLMRIAEALEVEPHKLVKLICKMGCLQAVPKTGTIADKALTL